MKTCDVCGSRLGMLKFRYADGCICKKCYEAASRNCSVTIRDLSFREIEKRCLLYDENSIELEEFEVTKRIGNYILIDEKNRRFCILNHGMRDKEYNSPIILSLDDIKFCVVQGAAASSGKTDGKDYTDRNRTVNSLEIEIFLHSMTKVHNISILSSPVRKKSYAFRRSSAFMQAITGYFESNGVMCKSVPIET